MLNQSEIEKSFVGSEGLSEVVEGQEGVEVVVGASVVVAEQIQTD